MLDAATFRLSLTVWPADKVTEGFCIETVKPGEDTETVNETVPWNPARLVTAIVDWLFWPSWIVKSNGLAASWKSGFSTVTLFEIATL